MTTLAGRQEQFAPSTPKRRSPGAGTRSRGLIGLLPVGVDVSGPVIIASSDDVDASNGGARLALISSLARCWLAET
jgi:hypothetical protein